MSRVSQPPAGEVAKEAFKKRNDQHCELRRQLQAAGLIQSSEPTPASRCCPYPSIKHEREARAYAANEHARLINSVLPLLLRLRSIKDTRQPKKESTRCPA